MKNGSAPVVRIVDDDDDLREGLQYLLESKGWRTACYASGESLLTQDEPFVPGMILLDIRLGTMSGVAVFDELRRRGSKLPVVFMTAFAEVDLAVEQMKQGAFDFIQKPMDPKRLFHAIEAALERGGTSDAELEAVRSRWALLTTRELGIVHLALLGLSNREIGERSGISERTVEAHRRMIYRKLDVHSLEDLKRAAKEAGVDAPVDRAAFRG